MDYTNSTLEPASLIIEKMITGGQGVIVPFMAQDQPEKLNLQLVITREMYEQLKKRFVDDPKNLKTYQIKYTIPGLGRCTLLIEKTSTEFKKLQKVCSKLYGSDYVIEEIK